MAELAAALPVTDLLTLDAPTDSALLWALVRHRLRGRRTTRPTSLADVVADGRGRRPGSRLNLLLTDGTTIWATAWCHALSVARPRRRRDGRLRTDRRRPGLDRGARPAPGGRPARRAHHPTARRRRGTHERRYRPARHPPHRRPTPTPRCAPTSAPGSPQPQAAAAEVVLRRPRQRAVRGDHRAARVLPDPHRAGAARRAASTRSRGVRRRHAGRAGLGLVGEDPAAARRVHAGPARCAGTCRRTSSESALRQALDALAVDYPGLALHGVVGDFTRTSTGCPAATRRMVAFLGGTIGNLLPAERAAFLDQLRSVLQPGEQLLLGTGLVIDEPTCWCRLRRRAGRDRRVQPQRAARAQPRAGRRLRRRRVRPRRAVGRRARVDRDAAARDRGR